MRNLLIFTVLLGLPGAAGAQQGVDSPDPSRTGETPLLFESHEPFTMTIRANFDELKGDRDQEEEERDGSAVITTPDGTSLDLSLEIRTRGRYRLERSTCGFPPLRLDFKKGELENTFLEGQDKLKLVTHCRDNDDYEQNVLEEYLVYRIYNEITDRSFRVRLARITYEDTSGEDDPVTRWGFLIEDEDALAERLGGTILEIEQLHPARVRTPVAGIVDLFQFMVGNTDFSLYLNHNVKLVELEGQVVPVPYDFDWAGFVDAPYAEPNPRLNLRSVRQRLFRGLCRPGQDYQSLYSHFNESRPAIEELVRNQPGLGEDEKEDALEYLQDFYEIIDDPRKARARIEETCRRA